VSERCAECAVTILGGAIITLSRRDWRPFLSIIFLSACGKCAEREGQRERMRSPAGLALWRGFGLAQSPKAKAAKPLPV